MFDAYLLYLGGGGGSDGVTRGGFGVIGLRRVTPLRSEKAKKAGTTLQKQFG